MTKMLRAPAASFFALAVIALAGRAAAQDQPIPLIEPHGDVWGELGFYTGHPGPAITTATMVFGGSWRPLKELRLRLVWPLQYTDATVGPAHDAGVDTGNPFFGVDWVHEDRNIHVSLGGGGTIPIAQNRLPATSVDQLGFVAAAALYGMVDPWLWMPNWTALLGTFHIANSRPLAGFITLSGNLAAGALIPIVSGYDVQLAIQPGFSIQFHFARWFSAGARAYLYWVPTSAGIRPPSSDLAQVSVTGFFRGDFERGFFEVSLTTNLNTPYGFAFDTNGFWGLHALGGFRF